MNKMFDIAVALALAPIGLTSCSSDDFLGTPPPEVVKAKIPILFNSKGSKVSRADLTGAEAAAVLNNEFRVYGTATIGDEVSVPFDNYMVLYNGRVGDDPTNVAGWTYISGDGGHEIFARGPNPPAAQVIHYWDPQAKHYDFVAFAGIPDDKRIVSDKSNTISADASSTGKVFFSNRVTATQEVSSTGKTPNAQYGVPYSGSAADVLFTFYRLASKIRCGIYETIPGYAVTDVRFYYDDNYGAGAGTSTKTIFGLRGSFPTSGDYDISYDENNDPKAAYLSTDVRNFCTFGPIQYTTAASSLLSGGYLNADGSVSPTGESLFIGSDAANITFAATDGEEWQTILPYPNNPQRLVLRVDFNLVPRDGSKAIICVKGAQAVVPLEFCQWRPNAAYTYIFKITDQVKGTTATPDVNPPDPDDGPPDEEALFPITFDAQVSDVKEFSHELHYGSEQP